MKQPDQGDCGQQEHCKGASVDGSEGLGLEKCGGSCVSEAFHGLKATQ